jgi:NTE family protein
MSLDARGGTSTPTGPSLTEPVTFIETDDPYAAPDSGIALCLSGGGYRAILFHVGALWRLNELGYLPKLDRVSSVSGGSITAAERAETPVCADHPA